jgi:hypothetical protein
VALFIIKAEPSPQPKSGFSYPTWYAENKSRLSEKRAKRYKEDKQYREAALRRSRAQRTTKQSTVTDGYTIAFNVMANHLGVTVWVLREWRRKNYFPEPEHRDGRLWFKPEHAQLLVKLRSFFSEHGVRVSESMRSQLEDVVRLVYANW